MHFEEIISNSFTFEEIVNMKKKLIIWIEIWITDNNYSIYRWNLLET